MKKLLVTLLAVLIASSAVLGCAAAETKIGVSIMELTAYTWYLGVIQGCEDWAAEHPEAGFTFQFEDSRSDVSTMLNNIDNLITGGAEAMILFPADASSAIPTMKAYVQQGIPFVIGDYAQQPASEETSSGRPSSATTCAPWASAPARSRSSTSRRSARRTRCACSSPARPPARSRSTASRASAT
ncbi:MAG: sugar ABC transporter substrate-binding protein [Clostridiales bacterium]|nr:sugar ABC transporter substrate-binding protein [Clostridiales bacterium]